jgi:hypothetical protein
MLKRVTDSYTEVKFWREVQFRRQRVLPVHENCSLDRYGDLQLPVDRPCLWSGKALQLGSDIPCYNSTYFRFTWLSSFPERKFGLTTGFYYAASFLILSSSPYTSHAMIVSLNKAKYFPFKFQQAAC